MRTLITLAALATLSLAGCSRVHIREDFGKYTRLFFARQVVHAEAAEGAATGLDSEEASLIHENYRTELRGNKATGQAREQQVLILEPSSEAKGKK